MLEAKRKMEKIEIKDRLFTLKEYILLSLGKPVYLGDFIEPGWKKPIPCYVFKCEKHGLVLSRVYGYDERVECPKCKAEALDYPSKEHEGL